MKSISKEKYNYLVKNTVLFTIANFSNKLIIFFLLPFYTAFLTTEEYAIIDIISIVQQLIFPILTLDITEAIIRFGIEKENNKKSIFLIGLKFVVIGNLILSIGCMSAIALSIGVKKYIIYFFIFNIVISINTLYSSFLRTVDKVNLITISSIINTIVTASLNIYFIARMKMGVDGYYLSFIIGNLLAIIIMMLGSKKTNKDNQINKSEIKKLEKNMIKYAIPLIPNALFWWVNSSLDRFFLNAISGLSYVGIYAAANKIPSILNTITLIVQQSWVLSVFKENKSKSKKIFFDSVYKFYNELIFIISIIIISLTKFICALLLSNEFYESWKYVPILILAFYFNSISSFVGTEFTAAKKTSWILITTIISAIVNIILNILLIKNLSCMGAAIATCISYFILLEARIIIINRKFELNINNSEIFFKAFIMCIMISSVIYLDNILNLLLFFLLIVIILFKNYNYYKSIIDFIIKSIIQRKEKVNEKNNRKNII